MTCNVLMGTLNPTHSLSRYVLLYIIICFSPTLNDLRNYDAMIYFLCAESVIKHQSTNQPFNGNSSKKCSDLLTFLVVRIHFVQ